MAPCRRGRPVAHYGIWGGGPLPDAVDGRCLGDLLFPLKEGLNVTVCVVAVGDRFVNNPPARAPLLPGMTVYSIAGHRLAWQQTRAVAGAVGRR